MSRIPNSSMKRARSTDGETQQMQQGQNDGESGRWAQMSQQMADGAARVAERARNNPGKAFAIGAGAIAAVAAPLFLWNQNGNAGRKTGNGGKSTSAKKSTGKSASRAKKAN